MGAMGSIPTPMKLDTVTTPTPIGFPMARRPNDTELMLMTSKQTCGLQCWGGKFIKGHGTTTQEGQHLSHLFGLAKVVIKEHGSEEE